MNEIEYEEFYLKYRQIAKSYAYGILEDWYLADDISQEVLYKMYTIRMIWISKMKKCYMR